MYFYTGDRDRPRQCLLTNLSAALDFYRNRSDRVRSAYGVISVISC